MKKAQCAQVLRRHPRPGSRSSARRAATRCPARRRHRRRAPPARTRCRRRQAGRRGTAVRGASTGAMTRSFCTRDTPDCTCEQRKALSPAGACRSPQESHGHLAVTQHLVRATRPFLARRTDLPQIADRQSGLRLCALLVLARCAGACGAGGRRRAVDAAWQGFRRHALQRTRPDHLFECRASCGSVWNFSTGVLSGHEGQPLVVKDTMYVVTPYPNVLYASRSHERRLPAATSSIAPDVNPGAAVRHRLPRLGESRRRLCRRKDRLQPAGWAHSRGRREDRRGSVESYGGWISRAARRITMAPLVVGDRVFVGPRAGVRNLRGWFKAL